MKYEDRCTQVRVQASYSRGIFMNPKSPPVRRSFGRAFVIGIFVASLLLVGGLKSTQAQMFGGDQTRAFCYVSDAVEQTVLAMEHPKAKNEILHVGNG